MLRPRTLAVLVALILLIAGCGGTALPASSAPTSTAAPAPTELPAPTTAGEPAVSTGKYTRAAFGGGWADLELPRGCDTREEVLARDAATATYGRDGCVATVAIIDPYTGLPVSGRANIDIDHVVALADAWRSGAFAWTDEQRRLFANDKSNLLATADEVNVAKSDRGPDRWRPPSRAGWCVYAGTYARTKDTYQLAVTAAQRAAVAELTSVCGSDR